MSTIIGPKHRPPGWPREQIEDGPPRPVQNADNGESEPTRTGHGLFVIPTGWGDGFRASIHGHWLELANPTDHRLAPSPDDLLIASLASGLAWSARRCLRAHGLPDDVSVSAKWQTTEGVPRLADIDLKVTVSRGAAAAASALTAALADSLAARSLAQPVVHISLDGADQ